jgi:hypothetical protein
MFIVPMFQLHADNLFSGFIGYQFVACSLCDEGKVAGFECGLNAGDFCIQLAICGAGVTVTSCTKRAVAIFYQIYAFGDAVYV